MASDLLKRAFDLVVGSALLIVTIPMLLIVAVSIKVDSRGPVLYKGIRVGRGGKPFKMFKFRTMVTDADRIGGPSTAGDDARITRVGHFLRRYKLDELPQLINVLKGDMSFVGPRPEVPLYVDMYTPDERRLLSVRPGITDWASLRFHNEGEILRGASDPEEAYMRLIRPEKIRLGLEYVQNRSLRVDIRIIAATLRQMLHRDVV